MSEWNHCSVDRIFIYNIAPGDCPLYAKQSPVCFDLPFQYPAIRALYISPQGWARRAGAAAQAAWAILRSVTGMTGT